MIPSRSEGVLEDAVCLEPGTQEDPLKTVPMCCQKFGPLDESLRTRGMDYIINTDNMEEDLHG